MTKAATGAVLLRHLLLLLLLLLLLHASPVRPSAQPARRARFSGHISENSPAGTPVDGVLIRLGAHGCSGADLNASLSGEYASDFRLVHLHRDRHRSHLGLVSSKALDREFIAMYELTVAPPCLKRPAAVQVEVSDRNDNIPRFTSGNRTVEVDELTPLGTELSRFDAKDGDAERNGRVTFYASPESHLLHVVPQTGQVRLVGSLLGVRQADSASVRDRRRGRGADRARRRPRALSEELTYTVTVPDHVTVGDLVFTVPDQRFEQRRFEVISVADAPVQIERDSGRLYLARSLKEPAEVEVKIQNLRDEQVAVVCVR
ncbi:hypothetical protein L3Q82_002283 [Scortum barcoo]|uniref:Uncharacterized protein n=1 Tax=Scortum barcoo TaxID=214431 RepID=A0ACB8VYB5_9TELE|nr:hypothetical protein L3Q82_002283 [Scortum barcoo]